MANDENDVPLRLWHYIKIPKAVQKAATRGLNLRSEYNRGGTLVGVRMAMKLEVKSQLPLSDVVKISQYFPRHANDNLDQHKPPSNGWIAWLLWGGDAGRAWSTRWANKWKKQQEKEKGR